MYSIYVDQYHFNTEQRGPQRKQHFEGGHIKKLFRFKDTLFFCHSLSLFGIRQCFFKLRTPKNEVSAPTSPIGNLFSTPRSPGANSNISCIYKQ